MSADERRCRSAARCPDREKTVERPPVCDPCECHGHGPGHPCTIPGGCGHLHPERTVMLGARLETPTGLCRLCTSHVTQAIRHLPLDVAELTVLIGSGQGTATNERVRTTPKPVCPIRVGIHALRADIDDELQCWVEPVAEHLGIVWDTGLRRRTRLGHRVQAAATLLAAAVPTLLALGPQEHPAWVDGEPVIDPGGGRDVVVRDGVDGALRLVELHRRVFAVAGRTKLVHRLAGPCPWCGQRTLTRENGADSVRCESSRCRGRTVPEQCYDWLAAVVAAEEKRLRTDKAA